MKVTMVFGVNKQEIINCSSNLFPKLEVVRVETKIDLIQDLANVDTFGDAFCILEFLFVGLVKEYSIGIAIFNKVKYLFANEHETLVPFSFDVIGALMVYCCEYLS